MPASGVRRNLERRGEGREGRGVGAEQQVDQGPGFKTAKVASRWEGGDSRTRVSGQLKPADSFECMPCFVVIITSLLFH